MKRQEFTIEDLGNVEDFAGLLTAINRIINLNHAYVTQVQTAKKYYENENSILTADEKRVDELIAQVETSPLRRADNRVPFNYHQILCDQKSAYLFGQMVLLKPMVDEGQAVDEFEEKLGELSKRIHRNLGVLSIDASNAGHGWLYAYINEEGEFKTATIDPEEIIPITDSTIEKRLMYVIRHYSVGKEKIIEFHSNTSIKKWRSNKFIEETPQFKIGEGSGEWKRLPFIEFANNPTKADDLHKYKALIDVYDKTVSLYANDIEDMQQLIFVLINYGGTDLDVFLDDLKKYKAVNMDTNGSLDTLKVDIPVEARTKLLELVDKSIWMSGQGVDPRLENLGNLSGTALKQLYGLLELKAAQMESEFRDAIEKLVDLFKQYLSLTGNGDFEEVEVEQIYTRSMISNSLEVIQMAQMSKGLISDETIMSNHPWVDNVKQELERLVIERKEAAKVQREAFGLNEDEPNGANSKQEPNEPGTGEDDDE